LSGRLHLVIGARFDAQLLLLLAVFLLLNLLFPAAR
jgi:hypothetical protein